MLGLLHFGAAGNPLEAAWLLLFPSSPPQAVSCDFAPCELNITVSVAFLIFSSLQMLGGEIPLP